MDSTVFKVPIDGSPVKGNADALVTLVEFSDSSQKSSTTPSASTLRAPETTTLTGSC